MEFRNNLSVNELENAEFMEIFAPKLHIQRVQAINESLVAVLYQKMITLVEIKDNRGFSIRQEIHFKAYEGLMGIE